MKAENSIGDPPLADDSTEKKRLQGESHGEARRFPGFFIRSALLLCLLPCLLILILHLPWVQKRIIAYAIDRIERNAVGLDIRAERFEWNPFSLLRLYHVEILSAGEKVLQSPRVELNYSLSWNWPYLYPVEIFMENPFLRLEKDGAGHWNVPQIKTSRKDSSSGESPFWVRFPWPRIRLASAMILAHQNGRSVLSIRDVNGTFSLYTVQGPKGPSLKINLGYWEGHSDIPTPRK